MALAKPAEWLIEGMLHQGCTYVMAGPAKLGGKTWLLLEAMKATASGGNLSTAPAKKTRSLYIDLENGGSRMGERIQRLGFGEHTRDMFFYSDEVKMVEHLREKILEHKERVFCVIDSLFALYALMGPGGDIMRGDGLEEIIGPIRRAAQRTGSTFVIVHHTDMHRGRMMGGAQLRAITDGWLTISPCKEPGVRHIETTARDNTDSANGLPFEFFRIADLPGGGVGLIEADPSTPLRGDLDRDAARTAGSKKKGAKGQKPTNKMRVPESEVPQADSPARQKARKAILSALRDTDGLEGLSGNEIQRAVSGSRAIVLSELGELANLGIIERGGAKIAGGTHKWVIASRKKGAAAPQEAEPEVQELPEPESDQGADLGPEDDGDEYVF